MTGRVCKHTDVYIENLRAAVAAREAEIQRLREALEFYAEADFKGEYNQDDGGRRAREALTPASLSVSDNVERHSRSSDDTEEDEDICSECGESPCRCPV